MPDSLYEHTIVPARAALQSLSNIITLAESMPESHCLLNSRLHDDMKPLAFQVHFVTSQADKMLARLTGGKPTDYKEDGISSFSKAHERIKKVLDDLEGVNSSTVEQYGELSAVTNLGPDKVNISGKAYACASAIPNMLFHVSITYAILRKEGVPLGKRDYIHNFIKGYLPS